MSVDVQVECTIERPVAVVAEFAGDPEGVTRMTLRNRGNPSGFSRVAAPMLERTMRRTTTKDLARLKMMLEASGGAS